MTAKAQVARGADYCYKECKQAAPRGSRGGFRYGEGDGALPYRQSTATLIAFGSSLGIRVPLVRFYS